MPGHKHTEIGLIPEDWVAEKLGNFISLQRGHDLTWRDRRSGVIPVMGSAGLNGFHDTAIAKGPGVVLGRSGASFGQAHYCAQDFWPHNTALYVTDFRGNDPLFVFYFLTSIDFSRHNSGGAQQSLNRNFIAPVPIGVPRPPEQRVIAAVLSDVDALLNGLERLVAKKRDLKQAAMQQLLTGQTRLPGFHGDWEVKPLGEISRVKTGPFGSSLHESDYVQDGTPIITVEHLGEFGVEHFNLPMVSDADRQRLKAYMLEIGDIVFSRVGSVDRNALIRPAEEGWLFSGRLLRVRPDRQKAFAPYLSHQFHSEAFIASVREVAVGQTMASLNTKILKGVPVTLPPLPEQTAIAGVFTDMDAELAALEQRLAKTRGLKQAMMQELLTGKTRLVSTGGGHA